MKPTFAIIAAVDADFGIGKNGTLPWQLPADLKHFKTITATASPNKKNAVIMGRKTWESLPEQFQPLPGRVNLVLSRQGDLKLPAGVLWTDNFDTALQQLSKESLIDQIFVIGGAKIFNETITHPACRKIYLTHIAKSFHCDCFFPQKNLAGYKEVQKSQPLWIIPSYIPLPNIPVRPQNRHFLRKIRDFGPKIFWVQFCGFRLIL